MNHVILSENKDELFVKGKILFNTVVSLRKAGDKLISELKNRELVINLAEIEKSDITGLTLILCWQRLCKRLNIAVKFYQPPESILKMAEVCGVKDLLVIEIRE